MNRKSETHSSAVGVSGAHTGRHVDEPDRVDHSDFADRADQPGPAPRISVESTLPFPTPIRPTDSTVGGLPVSNGSAGWESRYRATVILGDLLVTGVGILLGGLLGLGYSETHVPFLPWILAGATAVLVGASFAAVGAWDPRVLGHGSEEFGRVLKGTALSAVLLGLGGLAFELHATRPWVFGIVPAVGLALMLVRYGFRRVVHRRRAQGQFMHAVLAVGSPESVTDLIQRTERSPYSGWTVTGAVTPTGRGFGNDTHIEGVPVLGDLEYLSLVVGLDQFRVIAITPAADVTPRRLHQLAWDLEGSGTEMVVDPGLMEVAGPRLHVAPVDGLPLLRVTEPAFSGIGRVVKVVVDRIATLLLLALLLPVLVAIAIAVKTDGGPVFFRQTRLGQGGREFKMIKFRSMVVNAEKMRAELEKSNEGAGPLFKLRRDPRVTRVGAWLRKYSLDELPQLFNVLVGSMSLVGPRPPLPEEANGYSRAAQRRLLVKPGLTGLWQVSGRSNLSWEETVRLDLRYVENWSLALDALILWKTIGAVFRGEGAY